MQLKTLFNFAEKYKGYVYDRFELDRDACDGDVPRPTLRVHIRPAKRSKGLCSRCGEPGPTYDNLPVRSWETVPLWGIVVLFLYAMRRIQCARCGIIVEKVPWAPGKRRITDSFAWFLAAWAKRMSWMEVARAFHVSWDCVYNAVRMAVDYGLEHRRLDDVETIGVDEVMWKRKKKRSFLTVVYALDEGRRRLLWCSPGRKQETFEAFFDWFGEHTAQLKAVASDMWQAYLNVIRERAPDALNVLDRFHVVKNVQKAVDEVRAGEARTLEAAGKKLLKNKRWLLLKRPEKLSEKQKLALDELLLKINLNTVRAYLLKEELQQLWTHVSAVRACLFLVDWCNRAKASKLKPMARVAHTIDKHSSLILNWFFTGGAISSGAVEGFNNKLKVITRRAYGFRTYDVTSTALYHSMGDLPTPPLRHSYL